MSEPDPTPAAADAADRRQAERRRGEQRRLERALWQGAVGLLVGLAAIVIALLAGWRILALERSLDAERGAGRLANRDLALLEASLGRLEARNAAAGDALGRLEPLPGRLEALDGRVAHVEARIEAPQRALARAEAAHLVELASHRLALERDVRGAITLFEAAETRLAQNADPAALRARAQIAHDLAALRAVAAPDVGAIGARLAAAEAKVRELPMLGAIRNRFVAPGSAPPPPAGLGRAWWQLTTVFQDLVSVRRISDATVRLVSMEEIGVRRHHLETLLFAARLAALRADEADYGANIAAARDWLGRFFDAADPATRGVDQELAALAASRVSPDLPDVSGALRLLHANGP